jgi:hypothetical protein
MYWKEKSLKKRRAFVVEAGTRISVYKVYGVNVEVAADSHDG